MKDTILFTLVLFIMLAGAIYFTGKNKEKEEKPDRTKIVLDSCKRIIDRKDSIILAKEERYSEKKKADSITLFSINKSIKNVYYELKKQNEVTYSLNDSLFMRFVDSIRSAKGFYRLQY